MGVSIEIARRSVCRPPGVADSDRAIDWVRFEQGGKPIDLAFSLPDVDGTVRDRDPGRVVSAVFEPTEPFEQYGRSRSRPNVSHDSAHARVNLLSQDRRVLSL